MAAADMRMVHRWPVIALHISSVALVFHFAIARKTRSISALQSNRVLGDVDNARAFLRGWNAKSEPFLKYPGMKERHNNNGDDKSHPKSRDPQFDSGRSTILLDWTFFTR